LDKATAELLAMVQWRTANKMDELRERVRTLESPDFPHAVKLVKCFPKNPFHGLDKQGQPISIVRVGMVKLETLLRLVSLEELKEWFCHDIEKERLTLDDYTHKTGKLMRKCEIYDLNGLGLAHLNAQGLSYLKEIVMMGTSNYPESLGNMYIINAPWAFHLVWKTVRPWLKESTQAKIQILGADYQDVLRKAIEPANLPDWLGGQCTCSAKGGCVPHVDEDEGLDEVEVNAGASHISTVDVGASDVVSWVYRIRTKDIIFKVTFTDASGKKVPSKEEKHEATIGATRGEYMATAAGKLTLTWDNTYSRWTKKSLLFSIQKISRAADVVVHT